MGLEEYYASLASKQPSASNTNAPSPTSSNDEDFEELVPVAATNDLNSHGKRSRSPTADVIGKKAKVEAAAVSDESDEEEFDAVA